MSKTLYKLMFCASVDDRECHGVFSTKEKAEEAKAIAIESLKKRNSWMIKETTERWSTKGMRAQYYYELKCFFIAEITQDSLYDWDEDDEGYTKFRIVEDI